MEETSPQDEQGDRDKYTDAADEHSGSASEGDTPPAEGLGVGPTNPEMDSEDRGESATGKIAMAIILGVVALFVLGWMIGRIMGTFD